MNKQLTLDTRALKAQGPTELMEAALTWIEANPEAWQFIVAGAQHDALEIGRVRIKSQMEALRYRKLAWATKPIKLPNSLSAPFGRILAEWHQEIAHAIPLNASKTDGMSIPPRSY